MNNDKLTTIEGKLESIIDRLHELNITMAENTKSLIIHEKRTDLAERKLEMLGDRFDLCRDTETEKFKALSESVQQKFNDLDNKLSPIKNHVEVLDKMFAITWKYIVPGIIATIGALYKLKIISFGK